MTSNARRLEGQEELYPSNLMMSAGDGPRRTEEGAAERCPRAKGRRSLGQARLFQGTPPSSSCEAGMLRPSPEALPPPAAAALPSPPRPQIW